MLVAVSFSSTIAMMPVLVRAIQPTDPSLRQPPEVNLSRDVPPLEHLHRLGTAPDVRLHKAPEPSTASHVEGQGAPRPPPNFSQREAEIAEVSASQKQGVPSSKSLEHFHRENIKFGSRLPDLPPAQGSGKLQGDTPSGHLLSREILMRKILDVPTSK
jgi:hypothetical protein